MRDRVPRHRDCRPGALPFPAVHQPGCCVRELVTASVIRRSRRRHGSPVRDAFLVEPGGHSSVLSDTFRGTAMQMPTGKRRGCRDGKMGDLSPRIRRHIDGILSAALVRAIEQQPVARNPCDAFRRRLPKVERMEMTTLTTEPAQRLLDVIQHRRIYWPVLIALRRAEIPALRYGHGHGRAAARSASIR